MRSKVCYQWTDKWSNPEARMMMGVQKNPDGTGFKLLEPGDPPEYCEYCKQTISDYPHSHTKAERDELQNRSKA